MSNPFTGLGSRVEPQKLDDLCDQAVTCKALEAVSGLSNAIVKMALSNLTTEHLTKEGNQ